MIFAFMKAAVCATGALWPSLTEAQCHPGILNLDSDDLALVVPTVGSCPRAREINALNSSGGSFLYFVAVSLDKGDTCIQML